MNYPPCKLCLENPADKKNSHIIPKFMCKGIFESVDPRHAISINPQGKGRKVQDVPKENNILCSTCEKRIEILETYFSRVLAEVHNYKNFPKKFNEFKIGSQHYIECQDLNPTLFKLFIYSLVWRGSISTLPEFKSFNLEKSSEEKIRFFLNYNLTTTKSSLFEKIDKINNIPLYHSCFIKPKEKSDSSRGAFSIVSMNETSHILLLIDFALFFYTDETSIGDVLRIFSNKQNEKVYIALGEQEPWLDLNRLYLSKMLNSNPY